MNESLLALIVSCIILLTFCAIWVLLFDKPICYAKWEDAKYELLSGCLVNANGIYVPEKNVIIIKQEDTE